MEEDIIEEFEPKKPKRIKGVAVTGVRHGYVTVRFKGVGLRKLPADYGLVSGDTIELEEEEVKNLLKA
jgi:hypothetical protein